MSLLSVDKDLCKCDGVCAEVCPYGLITVDADGLPVETPEARELCLRCGHCVAVCPSGALSHSELPAETFQPALRRGEIPTEAVVRLLKSRRSVRLYKDKAVPREALARLLDVARFAPTAVNTQQVRWIVSADPKQTRGLAALAAEWLRASGSRPRLVAQWDRGRDVILRGAPHVAVACAPADSAWAATDCAIAVTFLDLAAYAFGLGGCWAGLFVRAIGSHPPLARALGLPEGCKAFGALMLGQPRIRHFLVPPRKAAMVSWISSDKEGLR